MGVIRMKVPVSLLDSLELFEKLLDELPDTAESVPEFLKFLRYFFRNKHPKFPLPSIEIISIIRQVKPTVFYFLRKQSTRDPILQMVIDLHIDVKHAQERIQELKTKL